jgi:hypothetical protein
MTHTYVLLDVSKAAYDEIKQKLLNAGYDHAINDAGEIDMHGIALVVEQEIA